MYVMEVDVSIDVSIDVDKSAFLVQVDTRVVLYGQTRLYCP